MIVADATLLAYLVLSGEHTSQAEALFDRDPTWLVPALCMSELRSVMSKYVRRDLLTVADAVVALERVAAIVDGHQHEVDSRDVLTLARKSKCTSYDCEYVSLAMQLGVMLVTHDKQVLSAFPKTAVTAAEFLAG